MSPSALEFILNHLLVWTFPYCRSGDRVPERVIDLKFKKPFCGQLSAVRAPGAPVLCQASDRLLPRDPRAVVCLPGKGGACCGRVSGRLMHRGPEAGTQVLLLLLMAIAIYHSPWPHTYFHIQSPSVASFLFFTDEELGAVRCGSPALMHLVRVQQDLNPGLCASLL